MFLEADPAIFISVMSKTGSFFSEIVVPSKIVEA